jgi:hypothetical protein
MEVMTVPHREYSPTAEKVLGEVSLPFYDLDSSEVYSAKGSTIGMVKTSSNRDYILKACNEYPKLLTMLEVIEALTNDKETQQRIREYFTEQNLW